MITWTPYSEHKPPEPGRYLGAVDWDEGATAERWWDGSAWWNDNIPPEAVDFDGDLVWEAPITHWAETPKYADQQQNDTMTNLKNALEFLDKVRAAPAEEKIGTGAGQDASRWLEDAARAVIAKAEGKS